MENITPKKHDKFCDYTKNYIEKSWGDISDNFSNKSKILWAIRALEANNISYKVVVKVSVPCSIDYRESINYGSYIVDSPRNLTPPKHDLFCETVEKYKSDAYENFKKAHP